MSTWNSRGLRGSAFEEFLNRTNEKYLEQGLALIQKIPTPITPIAIDKVSRHITLAYFDRRVRWIILAWYRGFRSVLTRRNATQIRSHSLMSMRIR